MVGMGQAVVYLDNKIRVFNFKMQPCGWNILFILGL